MATVKLLVPVALILWGAVLSISPATLKDTMASTEDTTESIEDNMESVEDTMVSIEDTIGTSANLDKNMLDMRIVGGKEAFIEDHPYQVSFVVNNSFFCGGFIVSENYILTAAHCAQDIDPTTVVLRAGSSWRKNGTIIPIAEVIPHPEYDQPPFDKDVGVMKTVEPISFNDVIQPIKLPPSGRSMRSGSSIMVSGWGKEKTNAQSIPTRLMEVEIPVVDYTSCYFVYPSVLTKNMWCGGMFFFGGKGTCQGDSGGAAIQDGFAVGIVSFGRGCAQPFSPSVFADIAAPTIRDFITEHTGL